MIYIISIYGREGEPKYRYNSCSYNNGVPAYYWLLFPCIELPKYFIHSFHFEFLPAVLNL